MIYGSGTIPSSEHEYYTTPIQYGWVCPKCGRVYAPFIPSCSYCGQEQYTTAYDSRGTVIKTFKGELVNGQ